MGQHLVIVGRRRSLELWRNRLELGGDAARAAAAGRRCPGLRGVAPCSPPNMSLSCAAISSAQILERDDPQRRLVAQMGVEPAHQLTDAVHQHIVMGSDEQRLLVLERDDGDAGLGVALGGVELVQLLGDLFGRARAAG